MYLPTQAAGLNPGHWIGSGIHEAKRHRRQLPLRVVSEYDSIGSVQTRAMDSSDVGIYLLLNDPQRITFSAIVVATTLGLGDDSSESFLHLEMEVACYGIDGLGLRILSRDAVTSIPHRRCPRQYLLIHQQQHCATQLEDDNLAQPTRYSGSAENWHRGLLHLTGQVFGANSDDGAQLLAMLPRPADAVISLPGGYCWQSLPMAARAHPSDSAIAAVVDRLVGSS